MQRTRIKGLLRHRTGAHTRSTIHLSERDAVRCGANGNLGGVHATAAATTVSATPVLHRRRREEGVQRHSFAFFARLWLRVGCCAASIRQRLR